MPFPLCPFIIEGQSFLSHRPIFRRYRLGGSRHAHDHPHHRFCRPGTGYLCPADGKSAFEPGRPGQRPVRGGKSSGHWPGAGRRVYAGILPDGDEARQRQGCGDPGPLSGRYSRLRGGAGGPDPTHRFSPDPWDALRHAAAAAAHGGGDLRQVPADRRTGKRDEPYQHWRHLPFRCGAGDGRGAADCRRQ